MKKRFLKIPVLLLLGILCPLLFSAHTNPVVSADDSGLGPCQAPPPGFFVVTNMTPTSVSLTWGPGSPFTYYKVTGFDNTNLSNLPTIYTTGLTHTYTGLTPGHNYTFTVSASYCPAGPYGQALSLNRTTPQIIIIDDIVGIENQCLPGTTAPTGGGANFIFCVSRSSNSQEPFNNAFVAELKYDANNTLNFGVAFNGVHAYIGKTTSNNDFSFVYTNPDPQGNPVLYSSVDCYYLNTKIFTMREMNIPGTSPFASFAEFVITFNGTFNSFKYCGSCGAPAPVPTGETGVGDAVPNQIDPAPANMTVNPNPFSVSTALQYELSEDGTVEISLYDATGRLVQVVEKAEMQVAGSHQTVVDAAGLPDGIYFLHLQTSRNREVFTLVKRE